MYCDQCAMGLPGGCTKFGVCGKDPSLQALQEALIYGLKGVAAYYYHAQELGYNDKEIDEFMAKALYTTLTNVNFNKEHFINYILEEGRIMLKTMELLDRAYVETFGQPEPVEVPWDSTDEAHGIIVTGHGYKDLYDLLKQIREMGLENEIRVYTHSEMLPAFSYPKMREFPSLYANLGKSWFDQRQLFSEFPGVILGTSNCVVPPLPKYADRMYTTSVAGLEGVKHVEGDYTELIKHALKTPKLKKVDSGKKLITGFHHKNLPYDKIIELINEGKISKIFVVGGCDQPNPKMSYYTKLVQMLPKDTLVLTAGCEKYRINHLDLGTIEGIPRLIDFGQCNNTYSIIMTAAELAKRMGKDLNELPVRLVISWMEQKAVGILYTLLYLGIKGIYLGPVPPRFLKQEHLKWLQEEFDLRLISEPEKDLKELLA